MTTLSAAQIAGYAQAAGWAGTDLTTAVAVALAESGGRTDARGDTALQDSTWGPSVGLWQIRSLHAQRGTGGQRDEIANLDPATNARHAHELWQASGWRPWSTWTSGAYRLYLGVASAAARTPTAPAAAGGASASPAGFVVPIPVPGGVVNIPLPFGGVISSGAEAASNAAELLKQVFVFVVKTAGWVANPDNWMRLAKAMAGLALVGVGVGIVARPVVEPAVRTGVKVAKTAGKVAAVAAA